MSDETTPPVQEVASASEPNQLERAEKAVVDMNAANDRFETLVKRQEQAAVKSVLGGKADAGAPPPKEESDAEYSAKVMANDL